MAGETVITVIGNLTNDPELKFTPSGAAVANFTVASNSRILDRQTNEWKEGDTLFLRCDAWRQLAEHVAESLEKGQRVVIQGALRVRNYERQDGTQGTSVEMNVYEVGPSLRYATAKVTKMNRSSSGGGFGGQGGGQQGGGQQGAPAANPWGGQPAQDSGGGGDVWGAGSTEDPPF